MTQTEQIRLSRELDLKVSRQVMGYAHFRFTRADGTSFAQLMTREDAHSEYIRSRNPVEVESGDEDNAPRYSTDIALSFQVAEKIGLDMIKVDDGWMVGDGSDGFSDDNGVVEMRLKNFAIDANICRAICLAAISAMESQG